MKELSKVLGVLMLCACSPEVIQPTVVEKERIEYRDRVVEVVNPADSARAEALLKCDENNNVIMTALETEATKNASLQIKVDSMGRLIADFHTEPDTQFVQVTDTLIIKEQGKTEYVQVDKELTFWQKAFILMGKIFTLFLLVEVCLTIYKNGWFKVVIDFVKHLFGK